MRVKSSPAKCFARFSKDARLHSQEVMGERRSQSRSQPRNSPDDESEALSMNSIRTGPAWAISSSSLPASSQRERISPAAFSRRVSRVR